LDLKRDAGFRMLTYLESNTKGVTVRNMTKKIGTVHDGGCPKFSSTLVWVYERAEVTTTLINITLFPIRWYEPTARPNAGVRYQICESARCRGAKCKSRQGAMAQCRVASSVAP